MAHRTNTRQLAELADTLANRLARIHNQLPTTLTRALDWTPAGTTTTTGPNVQGGDTRDLSDKIIDNRTKNIKEHKDSTTIRIKAITTDLRIIDIAVTRLEATLLKLRVLDPITARRLAEEETATGSECVNCRGWIKGTPDDRNRSGRCNTCRVYRDDHHGEERPHRLYHRTPQPGCTQCQRQNTEQVTTHASG